MIAVKVPFSLSSSTLKLVKDESKSNCGLSVDEKIKSVVSSFWRVLWLTKAPANKTGLFGCESAAQQLPFFAVSVWVNTIERLSLGLKKSFKDTVVSSSLFAVELS